MSWVPRWTLERPACQPQIFDLLEEMRLRPVGTIATFPVLMCPPLREEGVKCTRERLGCLAQPPLPPNPLLKRRTRTPPRPAVIKLVSAQVARKGVTLLSRLIQARLKRPGLGNGSVCRKIFLHSSPSCRRCLPADLTGKTPQQGLEFPDRRILPVHGIRIHPRRRAKFPPVIPAGSNRWQTLVE